MDWLPEDQQLSAAVRARARWRPRPDFYEPTLGAQTLTARSILSTATVGTPTFLKTSSATVAAPQFTLLINGVDRTAWLKTDSLNVNLNRGNRGSAQAILADKTDGTYRPLVGQSFVFWLGTQKLFAGLIQNGVETEEDQTRPGVFYYSISCGDYSSFLDRRFVGQLYTQNTLAGIVYDLITRYLAVDGFTLGTITTSISMAANDKFSFDWISAKTAFDQLANFFQADWRVDFDKKIHFNSGSMGAAPLNLTAGGIALSNSIKVMQSLTNYANRVLVKSTTGVAPLWCDTITGTASVAPNNVLDSVQQFFVTSYQIVSKPRVKVDGVEKLVLELASIGTGAWDWYYIANGFGVQQRFGDPPLTASQTLEICYTAGIPNILSGQSDSAIAARKAIEGGSGIYDMVYDLPGVASQETVAGIIAGILAKKAVLSTTVQFGNITAGWEPGQSLTIALSKPLVTSATYIVDSVTFAERYGSLHAAAAFLYYDITAVNGASLGTPQSIVDAMLASDNSKEKHFETATFFLINALAVGTSVTNIVEGQAPGLLREARIVLNTAPTGSAVICDIKRNGVSIFGATKLVLPAGSVAASQPFFLTALVYVNKGDVYSLDITQIGSTAAGGTGAVFLTILRS